MVIQIRSHNKSLSRVTSPCWNVLVCGENGPQYVSPLGMGDVFWPSIGSCNFVSDTEDQQLSQSFLAWVMMYDTLVLYSTFRLIKIPLPWNLKLTKFKTLGGIIEVNTKDQFHPAAQSLTVVLINCYMKLIK